MYDIEFVVESETVRMKYGSKQMSRARYAALLKTPYDPIKDFAPVSTLNRSQAGEHQGRLT